MNGQRRQRHLAELLCLVLFDISFLLSLSLSLKRSFCSNRRIGPVAIAQHSFRMRWLMVRIASHRTKFSIADHSVRAHVYGFVLRFNASTVNANSQVRKRMFGRALSPILVLTVNRFRWQTQLKHSHTACKYCTSHRQCAANGLHHMSAANPRESRCPNIIVIIFARQTTIDQFPDQLDAEQNA